MEAKKEQNYESYIYSDSSNTSNAMKMYLKEIEELDADGFALTGSRPIADNINNQGGHKRKQQQVVIFKIHRFTAAEPMGQQPVHQHAGGNQQRKLDALADPEGRGKDQAEHPVQAVNHVLKGVGNAAVKNNLTDVHAEAAPEQQPGQHTHGQKPKGEPTQHEA